MWFVLQTMQLENFVVVFKTYMELGFLCRGQIYCQSILSFDGI